VKAGGLAVAAAVGVWLLGTVAAHASLMLSDGRVVPGLEVRYEGGFGPVPATCDEAAAASRWRWYCRAAWGRSDEVPEPAALAGAWPALETEPEWPTDGAVVDPAEAREAARTGAPLVWSLTQGGEGGPSSAAGPRGLRSETARRGTLAVARPGFGRVWLVGLGAAGRP